MNRKLIAWSLLASLLTAGLSGCAKESEELKAPSETDSTPVVTIIRTKTPQLPFNEEDYQNNNQNQGSNQEEQRPDIQEKGDGQELSGYRQLLDHIDRNSFVAPNGWNRHPVDDLFDGVFETTDQGTNKYGTDGGSLTVEWRMDGAYILDAYTVVTGSDAENYADRNPKKWTMEGSANGDDWVIIHSVDNANLPASNYTQVTYEFENENAYRYYRWNIESTVGNGTFQASELLLYTLDGPRGMKLPEYGGSADVAKVGSPLSGDAAKNFISSHESLQASVKASSLYTDADVYGDGPVENLFDGVYTEQAFHSNGGGKMGTGDDNARVVWQTEQAVTLSAYAMVVGNDTSDWPERNPIAWTLYGSSDGKEWTVIDALSDGKMQPINFEPYVYEIESPASYSYYSLVVEQTNGGFQLCEFLMMK